MTGLMMLAVGAMAAGLPDIDSPLKTGQKAANDWALVIGIEDYAFVADVPFASRDATAFYDFLVYSVGVPPAQIRLLNQGTSKEQIEAAATEIGVGASAESTVWVYFAGHGAADASTGKRLLLGDDVRQDPAVFEARGVTVEGLVRSVSASNSQVRFLADACYGGLGRGGDELAPGKRFAVPTYAVPAQRSEVFWYGASGDQLAGPLEPVQHGAFTYLAIGALRGWADGELDDVRDGKVTAEEAQTFVARGLRALQIVDQTPELAGASDTVLVSSGKMEETPELKAIGAPVAMAAPAAAPGVRDVNDRAAIQAWLQEAVQSCLDQHRVAPEDRRWYVNFKVLKDGTAKTTLVQPATEAVEGEVPLGAAELMAAHMCIKQEIKDATFAAPGQNVTSRNMITAD